MPYLGIHPCGNLLRPRGYDLPSPTEAGYAKAGGQEPQGFLAKKGQADRNDAQAKTSNIQL